MIKTFTIDPNCLNSIENLSEILEHFGIEKWRVILKFPNNWNRLIKEIFKTSFKSRERKKAFSKLDKISKFIIELPTDLIPNEDSITVGTWFSKAKKLYVQIGYTGIVSDINPNQDEYIRRVTELDNWNLFDNVNCYRMRRVANDMAQSIKPLLTGANQIHFVDKHFQFLNQRHIRPLKEFITAIFSCTRTSQIKEIIYHTGDSALQENIKVVLRQKLRSILPADVVLKIVRWPDASMHNRFILTNLGGLSFAHGLDDWDNGTHIEFDDLTPLPSRVCWTKSPDALSAFMRYDNHHLYTEVIDITS